MSSSASSRRTSPRRPRERYRPCSGATRHTCAGSSATASRSSTLERRWLVERSAGGPREYCDFYRDTFGPAVAAYDSGRAEDVDRDFLAFATRQNRGEPDGPSEYHYEYLLVVARTR